MNDDRRSSIIFDHHPSIDVGVSRAKEGRIDRLVRAKKTDACDVSSRVRSRVVGEATVSR